MATVSKKHSKMRDKPKPMTKNMICNPTPYAYKLEATKAKIRSLNLRDPENLYWKQELYRHTEAIENARPIVDTSSPIVHKTLYQRLTPYNKGLFREGKIQSDNAKLLQHLAEIYNGEIKTGLETKPSDDCKIVKNKAYFRAMKTLEIMNENLKKFESLQNTKSTYSTQELSTWYAKQQAYMDRASKYPSQASKVCPIPLRKVMEKAYGKPRQYAYLLVEVEDKQAENVVVELYADLCPFTSKNFERLCTNTKATSCDCRTYRCKKIDHLHSVQVMDGTYKKLYWVIGEHVDSTVEYSSMMIKETSNISHTEPGLVTRPKDRAGGSFFITVAPCPHLDQFCYVFGKVDKKGLDFLKKMEEKNTEENGQVVIPLHITDCGVLGSPDDVPPPMLLRDFISQARTEIVPFTRKNPDDPADWTGGRSANKDYLKERAKEAKHRHDTLANEARNLAVAEDNDDDDD